MKLSYFKTLTVAAIAVGLMDAGCGDGAEPTDDTLDAATLDVVDVSEGDVADLETVIGEDVRPDDVQAQDTQIDTAVADEIVRFLFVSDIHFRAEEGQAKDDDGVADLVTMLNAIEGDFDYVVSGGDNYDHILPAWETDPTNSPLAWYVEEMDKLKVPWIAAIGNHEFYDFFGDIPTMTDDDVSRGQAFATVMGHPLYFTTEIRGTKLIILNSTEEGAWGETHGLMGKFSTTQFDWLRTELAEGKPSILFFHHPPSSFAPVSPSGQLCDVISEYPDVVKGIFAGHLHGFFKGDYCGVPYYMVEDLKNADNTWYEVEYNVTTDTLTILNESEIPFPVMPEFSCEPGESTVDAPESAVGTFQRMNVVEGVSDATGLGEMLGEMLTAIPFIVSIDGHNPATGYQARMTIASRWEVDGYLTYVDGSPCMDMSLHYKDGSPCFEAGPVSMVVQAIPFLSAVSDEPVNPDWKAVLDIRNMMIEGRIGNDANGIPVIADGIITATLVRDPTLNDMKGILVGEYCGGRTDGCVPGTGDLPVCPEIIDEAARDTIYAGIAYKCDVQIMGFGAQMLIDMVATLPPETHITGKVATEVLAVGPMEESGQVVDTLFLTDAGMNCASE